jgi:hypothetical protein
VSVLIFLGALLGLIAVAYTVNRLRGVHAHYIDDWQPDEGEHVLFHDPEADTFIVGLNRARYVSYARPRRGAVIVTDKRILAGTKTLFGRKKMLQYMMYGGSAPDGYSGMIDGGLFTRGYQTLVFLPDAIERVVDGKRPYVVLRPSPSEQSSINIDSIRIYTDRADSFPA